MEANGPTSMIEPEATAAARPAPLDGADGTAAPAGDSPPAAPVRQTPRVRRTGIVLKPNNSRVVIRPFELTKIVRMPIVVEDIIPVKVVHCGWPASDLKDGGRFIERQFGPPSLLPILISICESRF